MISHWLTVLKHKMPSQIQIENSWMGLVNIVHLCTPAQDTGTITWAGVGCNVSTGVTLSSCHQHPETWRHGDMETGEGHTIPLLEHNPPHDSGGSEDNNAVIA